MSVITIILTFFYLFFGVSPVFAIDPPNLINPQNNSVISSVPTFSWQPVSGSGGYNILIDDEPTVTSPYAKTPYYPTNPSYSPQTLNPGTYYWKVKAKDSNGNWGSFSSVWSFTLTSSYSNPTPTPTQTPNPTPTATPDPTTAPNSNTFFISNTPTQINSDQSFTSLVNLSLSDKPNTNFYLKGAFKKTDSSNYFGLTKVSGSWIKNGSSYSNQMPITTDLSGNWSGNLDILVDSDDSGYTGTGDYIFKVGRYDTNGNGPTWSNEVSININNVGNTENPTGNTQSSSSRTTTSPTPTTSAILSKSSISQSKFTKVASVAGVSKSATSTSSSNSSPSANTKVASQKQINPFILVGIIFIIGGVGSLGYIFLRKNETVYKYFRRRN